MDYGIRGANAPTHAAASRQAESTTGEPMLDETISGVLTSFDPMLAAANEFAVRFNSVADRLFGAIPSPAAAERDTVLGNDEGPVIRRIGRRRLELQRALNMMSDALTRLERHI